MKAIYYYFVGLSQGINLPGWLPLFITGEYLGDNTYRWFGIKIKTKSFGGETLFMYWRRILLERICNA